MLEPMRKIMKDKGAQPTPKKESKKGYGNAEMPAFPSQKDRRSSASPEAPSPPGSVNALSKDDKAKTFRKRRLSLNPMDADVIEAARQQHIQEAAEPEPSPT